MTYSRRQLYALGEPLGDAATSKAGGKVIYGGGGGGGPSQQTITQSNIPDWLRPQVETVLGGAMQEMFTFPRDAEGKIITGPDGKMEPTGVKPFIPYSANPADYVAGFSPLQQQAMYGAAGLQVPGQFGSATQMSGMAGMGGLGAAGRAGGFGDIGLGYGAMGAMGASGVGANVGNLARGYAAQQADAGRQYAGMATSPQSVQAYMSPYMQNVVDAQQQAAQRQADIANQAMQARFAQSGAFGGARHGIQQAQAAADLARQKQGIQAQGLQNAFQQAQQAQQFGAGLGLQGLAGAQQGLGNVLQGGALGLQGMQTGMQGAGMGLKGVETGLAGYGLLGQQAGVMGDLGTKELAARQGIIGTQSQLGGMEQQQQQNIINQAIQNYAQAQQYPLQQYNAYNALLRGYAVPGQTATSYQAAPSLASQAAGLGMGIAGISQLAKKKGGTVKAMAEGGVSEINDKVRNNPTKYSEEQIKRSTANEIIDPQTAAIALGEIARARKAAQGVNMLQSGLPAQGFAPGGIVAFDDGGKVERYQNQGLVPSLSGAELGAPAIAGAAPPPPSREEVDRILQQLEQQYRRSLTLPEILDVQSGRLKPAPTPPPAPPAPSAAPAAPPTPPQTSPAPPPPAGGVASLTQPPRMTAQEILSMAQGAGKDAGSGEMTPEKLLQLQQAAMPQGAAAYTTPLTPLQEELARESREAAAAGREESRSVAERMEKLRTSQEERIKAKEKSLSTDRNQALGIAFLEAAQAMTQPGQTFFQGLTRSAAAGGKRLLEERERINIKSEKLAEALDRLDEARLGDQRERNAAEAQYRNAMLGVRKEMVNNAMAAYGMNRDEANKRVDAVLKHQVDLAALRQGAERNAIAAAGVAQQGRNTQLELYEAALNNPRLAQMLTKSDKSFSEFTDFLKANPQLAMQSPAKQLEAFVLAKQMLNPTVYSSAQPPANAIPYTPPAR